MKSQIKKTIALLLAAFFVLLIAATSANAALDFTAAKVGNDPHEVVFNPDLSGIEGWRTGWIVEEWYWDFGDGETSKDGAAVPTHKYNNAGTYDVRLSIFVVDWLAGGSHGYSVTKTIKVPIKKNK